MLRRTSLALAALLLLGGCPAPQTAETAPGNQDESATGSAGIEPVAVGAALADDSADDEPAPGGTVEVTERDTVYYIDREPPRVPEPRYPAGYVPPRDDDERDGGNPPVDEDADGDPPTSPDDGEDEPIELLGVWGGLISCEEVQWVVGTSEPNLPIPDDPAIVEHLVQLGFPTPGQPESVWMIGYTFAPHRHFPITMIGDVFQETTCCIKDNWSMVYDLAVVDAAYTETSARTEVEIVYQAINDDGVLMHDVIGSLTQEVTLIEGRAWYESALLYEATMYSPDHVISIDVVIGTDCAGWLD